MAFSGASTSMRTTYGVPIIDNNATNCITIVDRASFGKLNPQLFDRLLMVIVYRFSSSFVLHRISFLCIEDKCTNFFIKICYHYMWV